MRENVKVHINAYFIMKEEVLGRTDILVAVLQHVRNSKRCLQQFLAASEVFAKTLARCDSNMTGGVALRCNDVHTKFCKVWFRLSKVNEENVFTDSRATRRLHKPTLVFAQR
jgi:hypothetical protein